MKKDAEPAQLIIYQQYGKDEQQKLFPALMYRLHFLAG